MSCHEDLIECQEQYRLHYGQDSKPDDHDLWQRCNDMVLSWILNSLEPVFADSVLSRNTPHAIWEDLRARFSLVSAPRILLIERGKNFKNGTSTLLH